MTIDIKPNNEAPPNWAVMLLLPYPVISSRWQYLLPLPPPHLDCEFWCVETHYLCHENPIPGTKEMLSTIIRSVHALQCSQAGGCEIFTSFPTAPLAEMLVMRSSFEEFLEIH